MSTTTVSRRTTPAQRRSNAVARADALTVDYFICPDQQTVIVASATTPGKLYIVTASECSCPAGRRDLPCKHAEYRVQVLFPRTPRQSDADYAATLTACDELF